ncbi:GNAT family N-acetyltransferase [Pleurocapsales cyanobacterium LEGE 10410]|nr:GNAT family N-acetyltransferase [Pleurocapsales cyanobacterium LEGE 10410]
MNSQKPIQIQTIEELSLNALPCLQQILDDGWVLRFAEGYTKRANSVTPLYAGSPDLAQKIQRCEKIYHRFKLKPMFRLADIPQLETLDRALEELAYVKGDRVSVQTIDLNDSNLSSNDLFPTIAYELSQEWLDHYVHAVDLPLQHWHTMATMLEIIPNPTCYAWLKNRQRFCSCGLGVIENDYLGLFFIATAKHRRGKGYARQLVSALLDWGKHHGATKAYVQVETNNQSAINLYNKLGFTEVYQYFYRIKP